VAVAAAGIWIFFRQVNVTGMILGVRATPLWKIALVVLLNPATLGFRAWRWSVLLPDRRGVEKHGFFPIVVIAFMVNNILPARIGEAVRAALLWKRNRFSIVESVGSILVERFLDIIVFTLFLFIPFILNPELSSLRFYGYFTGGGLFVVFLSLLAYSKWPHMAKSTAERINRLLPCRVQKIVVPVAKELVSNLDWLFSPKKVVVVVALSLLTILCQVVMLLVLGHGIAGFGFLDGMFGIACAALGAAIPLAPGYVGTLHAVMVSGLSASGIPSDNAGAIAVLYHGIGYVTVVTLGTYYFFRMKISFSDIRESVHKKTADQ